MTFANLWAIDFEYTAPDGERPIPICLVARELRSGRELRFWEDELRQMRTPPFGGLGDLVISFSIAAELSCYLALGWPMPANLLDLYAEFRVLANGRHLPCGEYNLLSALAYHGLPAMSGEEKQRWRALAIRGGPYTADERAGLLDYCAEDVHALDQLYPRMAPGLSWPHALLRGRYGAAVARMEWTGVPIDTATFQVVRDGWEGILDELIHQVDDRYHVYGEGRTIVRGLFARWLNAEGIPWERLESGALSLESDTFRDMAKIYPQVEPLKELQSSLGQLRLNDLQVGRDGRNRCGLFSFGTKTGRNKPSSSKYVFGPSVWIRPLIKPDDGSAIAYLDWSQQEFGEAAAFSADSAMLEAYESGDCYLAFARQAGAVPAGATAESHRAIRNVYKQCALAVQYGMEAEGLSLRINQPVSAARALLRAHRETYKTFWRWSDRVVDHAALFGELHTTFGWRTAVGADMNPRSVRNFPMQANGAEMLRLACCLATERGIAVCAPVHDALLIEAPVADIEEAVAQTQQAMREASRTVLAGFELRTEATITRAPDRYVDKDRRGVEMWEKVMGLLKWAPGSLASTLAPGDGSQPSTRLSLSVSPSSFFYSSNIEIPTGESTPPLSLHWGSLSRPPVLEPSRG